MPMRKKETAARIHNPDSDAKADARRDAAIARGFRRLAKRILAAA